MKLPGFSSASRSGPTPYGRSGEKGRFPEKPPTAYRKGEGRKHDEQGADNMMTKLRDAARMKAAGGAPF